jgi:cell division ATPase FtsA
LIIELFASAAQIASMLMTPVERLTGEIAMCHDYYREESGGGKVDSVVFFGGGASLAGLVKTVSDSLGMAVKLGDPLKGIRIENGAGDGIRSRLDVAVGAALSAAKGINLLPPEIKEKKMLDAAGRTLKIAAFSLTAVLMLIFFGIRGQINDIHKRIAAAGQELSGLEGQFRKAEAKIVADKVLINEPQWEDVFTELSNLVRPAIHLTAVSMRNNVMTIRGTVGSEDGAQALSDFVLILERGLFSDVKLISSRKSDEGPGTVFELRCRIDYEG